MSPTILEAGRCSGEERRAREREGGRGGGWYRVGEGGREMTRTQRRELDACRRLCVNGSQYISLRRRLCVDGSLYISLCGCLCVDGSLYRPCAPGQKRLGHTARPWFKRDSRATSASRHKRPVTRGSVPLVKRPHCPSPDHAPLVTRDQQGRMLRRGLSRLEALRITFSTPQAKGNYRHLSSERETLSKRD